MITGHPAARIDCCSAVDPVGAEYSVYVQGFTQSLYIETLQYPGNLRDKLNNYTNTNNDNNNNNNNCNNKALNNLIEHYKRVNYRGVTGGVAGGACLLLHFILG